MSSDSAIQYFQRPVVGHLDPAWRGTPAAGPQRQSAALPASGDPMPNADWRQSGTELERIVYDGPEGAANEAFSFADLLDVVNPLQHIPVISSIYREVTGDQISGAAIIAGGTLFGGPLGFISSLVETVASEVAGGHIGDSLVAAALSDETPPAPAAAAQGPTTGDTAPVAAAVSQQAPQKAGGRTPAAPDDDTVAAVLAAQKDTATTTLPNPQPVSAGTPASQGTLTGEAALGAFLSDLRGIGQQTSAGRATSAPVAKAPPPAKVEEVAAAAIPLREQDWQGRVNRNPPSPPSHATSGPAAATLAGGGLAQAAVGGGEFSQQMLMALDKYEAMAKSRYNAPLEDDRDAPAEDPRP